MAKQYESAQGMQADGVAIPAGPDAQAALLTEVDFKWLMAGQGCWVDSARLQADASYASDMLKRARASSCTALRDCAVTLQAQMVACAPATKAPDA